MTCRCGKDHSKDAPIDIPDVIRRLAQQIADDIDREIVERIMEDRNPHEIPPIKQRED